MLTPEMAADIAKTFDDVDDLALLMLACLYRMCKIRHCECPDVRHTCPGCPVGYCGIRNCIEFKNLITHYLDGKLEEKGEGQCES